MLEWPLAGDCLEVVGDSFWNKTHGWAAHSYHTHVYTLNLIQISMNLWPYTQSSQTHTRHNFLGSAGNRDPLQCWRNEMRQQDMGNNKISSPLGCTSLNQHRGAVVLYLLLNSRAHEAIPYTDHHSSILQITISVHWDMCLCAKLELIGRTTIV